MNNLEHQVPVQISDSEAEKLSKRRRAFIKGTAVALPAVLTLRNGSAFAAESLSCLAKQANATPATLATVSDGYVRDQTKCRVIRRSSTTKITVYEYPVGSGVWFPETSNSTDLLNSYHEVSPNPVNGIYKMVKNNTTDTYTYFPNFDQPCYVLAQLDPNTGLRVNPPVVGPKGSNQPNVVATNSCMASLVN